MKKLILKVSGGKPERLAILLFLAMVFAGFIGAVLNPSAAFGAVILAVFVWFVGFILYMLWNSGVRNLFYRISFHLIHWSAKDR